MPSSVSCFSVQSPAVEECLGCKIADGDGERLKSAERMRVIETELVRTDTSELQLRFAFKHIAKVTKKTHFGSHLTQLF